MKQDFPWHVAIGDKHATVVWAKSKREANVRAKVKVIELICQGKLSLMVRALDPFELPEKEQDPGYVSELGQKLKDLMIDNGGAR